MKYFYGLTTNFATVHNKVQIVSEATAAMVYCKGKLNFWYYW